MERLDDATIEERLLRPPAAWQREGEGIVRDVSTESFAAAIDLVNRIAVVAERRDHHPDILVHDWRHVRLTLSTHSAGGITAADFGLADELDELL